MMPTFAPARVSVGQGGNPGGLPGGSPGAGVGSGDGLVPHGLVELVELPPHAVPAPGALAVLQAVLVVLVWRRSRR